MKKQCKIIEDLLPLYHDGVCSEESKQWVDEHLTQCEDCRHLLCQISGELIPPVAQDEELKPLMNITKTVNKGKRKALIAGISIALSAVVILFAVFSIRWYTQEYTYYAAFAAGHDPHSIHNFNEDGSIAGSIVTDAGKYTWYDDTYRYHVEVPGFLSGSGSAEMTLLENDQVFLSVSRWNGTTYVFHVGFFGDDHRWTDADGNIYLPYFIVDCDLKQYYPEHWSDALIQENNTKFVKYQEEIRTLIRDAIAMWTFIK